MNSINTINICISRIMQKLKCVSKDEFIKNEDLQDIVSYNILIINEEIKKLPNEFKKQYTDYRYKQISDLSSKIISNYDNMIREEIYDISINNISKLNYEL